jgi:hypothetical protein
MKVLPKPNHPIMEVVSRTINGVPDPDYVSKSYVERQNLTIRTQNAPFYKVDERFLEET